MQPLTLTHLSFALLPVLVVAVIYARWQGSMRQVLWATTRMVVQLLLVGYALQLIFAQESKPLSLAILLLMILVSTAISLRHLSHRDRCQWQGALLAIGVAGSLNLALVVGVVLDASNWYAPDTLIPLAGMVYANCMNAVSLASERFDSDSQHGESYPVARNKAFGAAMLPQINSLLAVGLVSLPGMMTGQILSGVSPLIAVRYQIMVMCMILGSAGISAALYLWWLGRKPQYKLASTQKAQ